MTSTLRKFTPPPNATNNSAIYIPKTKLNFDSTGKLMLYSCEEDASSTKHAFGLAAGVSLVPAYFLFRAIQRRSMLRICFWTIPTLITGKIGINAVTLGSRIITFIYLKENGTEVVVYTMNGLKYVAKIVDIKQTKDTVSLIEQFKMT